MYQKGGVDMSRYSNVYSVMYRDYEFGTTDFVCVIAHNKEEAYDLAVYEIIPDRVGICPYSAWVESVTYQNGNCHYFNTSEGNAY